MGVTTKTRKCRKCGKSFPADNRCRPCKNAKERGRYKTDPTERRRLNLWARFKMTPEDFAALEVAQNFRCAICNETVNGNLHVDHDHKTLAIRGLLCRKCNTSIGMLADDPVRIRAAADYVERASSLT